MRGGRRRYNHGIHLGIGQHLVAAAIRAQIKRLGDFPEFSRVRVVHTDYLASTNGAKICQVHFPDVAHAAKGHLRFHELTCAWRCSAALARFRRSPSPTIPRMQAAAEAAHAAMLTERKA